MGSLTLRATKLVPAILAAVLGSSSLPAAGIKVVLNEVCYHPADDARAGEFVELHNHGTEPADLTGWVLIGGVDYAFPQGTTIGPGAYLVVGADPATLKARYSLDPALVKGPYSGSLDNDGERLELWTAAGHLMSFVEYEDSDPWPEAPDGLGPSLERLSPLREEHDAEAWAASIAVGGTPGSKNSVNVDDPAPPPTGSQFIPRGSTWRFFRGRTEPPASWAAPGFNDAAWETGPAGFGYDDADDATILTDMQSRYTTVYVRRAFQVSSPAAVESLTLNVLYDDGYVAYLNGVEIDRANVPGPAGTPLPFNALSSSSVEPPLTRVLDITALASLLVPGANVLAVQGVNSGINNRDFSLHPWLEGSASQGPQEPVSFVLPGDDWRFFRGVTDPPAAWRDLSFVDDAWEEGPSGIGYGDGDDATLLTDMEGSYLAVFARRRFQVADASKVESLALWVDYDDGFIAYLNGVEVARANVAEAGASGAAGGSHEAGVPEEFPIPAPAALLRTGINVLAVEGHNSDLASSDFSLAPSLSGALAGEGPGPGPSPAPERPPRDVVLNEVFASSGGDGWVEVYNATAASVDLSGRRILLFPETGGSYAFPGGTSIAGRGRRVVTEAELGFPLTGAPVLILATSDGRFIDALNPRTAPAGMSTGRWPDGSEDRYVLSSPSRDGANSVALETRVVVNEIQYHPADGNLGGEFIELHNRGGSAVDVSGWSFTRGVEYTIPQGTSVPAGGFLVVAKDPSIAQAFYQIPLPLGPYAGSLRNDAETILLRDALGNAVDRVRYADDGSWPPGPDGTGPSLELVHAALENRYGPAWRASAGHGTPGAPSSARMSDPPPIVAGVEHSPVVPSPSQDVLVTAAVSDERPIVSATLFWRADGSGANPAQVPMVDDGAGDDGIASNGVFGAVIPARPDRTIVLFWIQAQAQGGQSVTAPAGAPSPAFLYQVEGSGQEGIRPTYRIVMQAATLQTLRTRDRNSDVLLDCTFVSSDRARYNRGIRYRGSSARSCNPLSYRVQFDHDADLSGFVELNLNGCNPHRQWIGLDFLARAGIPAPESWFRVLSINGTRESQLYLRVESLEEPFLERVFPDADEDGNLYRGVNQANLDYRGESFGPYTANYEKHTNEDAADWSDVVDLCFRFDADTTSGQDFPAAIEAAVDIDEWALYFAAFAVLGSTENSILLNNGDDYFLYHRPSDGKWMLLPWDLDSCFDESTQVLFRPTVDQIERFLEHPRYAPLYWCHLESLLENALVPEIVDARVDHLAPLFSAARVDQLRQYAPARRAYIEPRLSRSLTWSIASGGSACGDSIVASGPTVGLEGAAPGCGTTEVRLNGQPAAYDPQTARWSGTASVAGAGSIAIAALDRNGLLVARRDVPIRPPPQGTALPASITTSRTLRASDGPYRVAGTVTVQAGVTVTAEPGATLLFGDDGTLVVQGQLAAAGTSAEPVRFVRDSCGGAGEGLVLRSGGAGTRLSYCEVVGLRGAAGYAAGISIDGGNASLDHVTVTGPQGRTAIDVRGNGNLVLDASRVRDCGTGALFTSGGGLVTRCIFTGIDQAAIAVTGNASIAADHLTIHGCGMGFDLRERSPGAGSGDVDAHSVIAWQTPAAVAEDSGSRGDFTHSDLAGGVRPGDGNISADPRFVDAPAGDLRLRFSSPGRGTGKDGTDMGALPYEPTGETSRFLRCDTNADGSNDIADAVATLLALFGGRAGLACWASADCNADGLTDLSDALFDLAYLFTEGPPPPGAYPACEEGAVEGCGQTTCVQ
ncbi:MAG: lamin tail domain-containing protein [Planctomycetes bacterium]|nr:lamin tail domain-containing protein [Planctomycetota bacterium]